MKRSLAAIGFVILCLGAAASSGESASPEEAAAKFVRYGFTLRNKGGSPVPEAHLWTYAPVKNTAFQRCIRLRASHPYELTEDEWGNQVLHFTFTNLPPYARKVVDINAELLYLDQAHPASGGGHEFFLDRGNGVVAGELAGLAESLRDRTATGSAGNIHSWVAANIEYTGYSSASHDGLQTLRRRQGDCTEFMALFVALARAAGVPARGVAGYVLPEGGSLRPTEFHNWAEFHDGKAWRLADPQRHVFLRSESDYVAMRVIGPSSVNPMGDFNRFRFAGEGLSVEVKL